MGAFWKLASLGAVICGGSLLTLWLLAGGHSELAGLALFVEAVLAIGSICMLTRDGHRSPLGDVDGSDQGSPDSRTEAGA